MQGIQLRTKVTLTPPCPQEPLVCWDTDTGRHRQRKSLFEGICAEMEVAQGPGVRTCETPRVGVSNRKGFLRELLTDGVILTASKEVIPLDSSAQSGQHK